MNNRRISSSEFIQAARDGDMKVIEQYIAKNGSDPVAINATDKDDNTALIWAANNGHTAAVQALVNAGAKIDTTNQLGNTALIRAVDKGHTNIVQALIDAGAKIDTANINGNTALIMAAYNGHITIVQALINAGAKIDTTNQHGNTALILAAYNDHTAAVQALINAGANIDTTNKHGDTALIWTANQGHAATVQALIDAGANIDTANQLGNTALSLAASKGHATIVQALINAGAKIDTANRNGDTALSLAAGRGHATIAQALINAGAKIDTANRNGDTALMIAANQGHDAVVRALLNAGAKINKTRLKINLLNNANHTALSLAAYNGHAATVQTLIDAGAEIHQCNIDASYQFNSKERKAAKIILTAKINNIHKQRLANGNKPEDIINAVNEQTKYEYDFLKHIYRELFYSNAYDNQPNISVKKLMSLAKHLYKGLGYDSAEAVRFLTNDLDAMPNEVKALASDLLAYLERKKKPSIYISAIEQALNELKKDIASANFYVKDIKGNWVLGKPRHIATIESILKQQRKTWADTLGTYSKVMTLLDTEASILQKGRHPDTIRFYKNSLEKLRGIRYDGSNSHTPMPPSYEDHLKMYPNSDKEYTQGNTAAAAAAIQLTPASSAPMQAYQPSSHSLSAAAVDLADLPPPTYAAENTRPATKPAFVPAIQYSTQTFMALFPPVPTTALPALPSDQPAEKRMLNA